MNKVCGSTTVATMNFYYKPTPGNNPEGEDVQSSSDLINMQNRQVPLSTLVIYSSLKTYIAV